MRVLLLDTGFSALPIYEYLEREEHEVWVMGNRELDVLARLAGDRWIRQDYSRVRDVDEWVRRYRIERVVPGCTDVSLETCIALDSCDICFDEPAINHQLTHKEEFRALCRDLGLPAPKVVEPADFPQPGRYICKPVDSFSGRGVTVFDGGDAQALERALRVGRDASRTGKALIETFAVGELYSFSAFVENGDVAAGFFVREGCSANLFAVDTSYVVESPLPGVTAYLHDGVRSLVRALNLRDGLLHVQFILEGHAPRFIEVTRRCPGDLYSLLIEYSTGYPYAAKYASYFVGARFNGRAAHSRPILRHTVSALEPAILKGIVMPSPRSTIAFFPLEISGKSLVARQGTRVGILFIESASQGALREDYDAFLARRVYALS